jgi:hypothetical protein
MRLIIPLIAMFAAVTHFALAGQIIPDWPDIIICKKQQTIGATTTIYQLVLFLLQIGQVQNEGQYVAEYASTHYHDAVTGKEYNSYIMLFQGPSAAQASAAAVPSNTIDCPPGITILQLQAQGQTRSFGP